MGVCFECRVTVDGIGHQRACMLTVRDGMDVRAADAPPHEPGP
jgi:sarcosine oxidase subunit alpha